MANTTWQTVNQAAEHLAASTDTVRALIDSGELPASDISLPGSGKRRWRIAAADLDEFLRRRRNVKPTPQPRRKREASYTPRYY